jgi:hypothetical protein
MADETRSASGADPRLDLIYQEALRGLVQQRSEVESLRGRAGTLIFAASFASSLLGSVALANGFGPLDWVAVALLLLIGGIAAMLLWPYYDLAFRLDPDDLMARYVDRDDDVPMATMHRQLARRLGADWRRNGRVVRRLRVALQAALVTLLVMMLAWMLSIAMDPPR